MRYLLTVILMMVVGAAAAAPHHGDPFTYRQPNGKEFKVRLWGDEFFAYHETEDGYLVVRDPITGFYCYAKVTPNGNDIISTGVRVGGALPPGLARKQRLSPAAVRAKSLPMRQLLGFDERGRPLPLPGEEPAAAPGDPQPAPPTTTTTGKRVGLVLLASFPDRPGDVVVTQQEVDDFCNAPDYRANGNAASVNSYFLIQSNGRLDYKCVVSAYFVAANVRDYYMDASVGYGTRARELIREGLAALDATGFDFTQCDADGNGTLDGVNCFYAGTRTNSWSEGLWPHASSTSWTGLNAHGLNTGFRYQITDMAVPLRIGTFCHENGHMICRLPDLYSYDGNAANVWRYSLMQTSGSTHPPNIDPYLKFHAGWADMVELDSSSHQRCVVQIDRNYFYRYRNPLDPQEYFVFEARDNTGYEGPYGGATGSINPTRGLAVFHALQTGNNPHSSVFTADNPNCDYSTPYELMVVEASPAASVTPWYDDPTPGSNDGLNSAGVSALSDTTTPALKFWASDGRTVASQCNMHSVSAAGPTMSFIMGSGALTHPPELGVTATALSQFIDAGTDAANQDFAVFNVGTGTLSYTVSANMPWLSVSPLSGTVGTEIDTLTISYSTVSLLSGQHNATITIDSPEASNSPRTVSVTLTVTGEASPPVFTVQPASVHLLGDANHTISPWVTGSPTPDVQWYRDGVPVSGAQSIDLSLTSVTASDAGSYHLVASNTLGVATSDTAVITVNDHPYIVLVTPQSTDVNIYSGMGLCLDTDITDDGYGGSSLSVAWSAESVPVGASVTWDTQTSNSTAVKFSDDGAYTLRVTASDGINSTWEDFFVEAGAVPTPPPDPLDPTDMVVLLHLDDGSGTTAIDSDGGNNNGTLSGGASFTATAVHDGGVDFNGVDGRVTLANSSLINTATMPKRTIAFWFKAHSLGGRQVLYEEGGSTRGFNFYLDGSTLYWGGWNNFENGWGTSYIAGPAMAPGDWHHVALVLDATPGGSALETDVFRVYLDGVLYASDNAAPINAHSDGIALGAVNGSTKYHSGSAAGDYFDGEIDEFYLLNRALTATELSDLATIVPNIGPAVHAGPPLSAGAGTAVALDGTVADDGLPGIVPVTTKWLVMSGPTSVTFGDIAAVDTTASAAIEGTYVLRLTADDGHTKTFAETVLDVFPNLPGSLQFELADYSVSETGAIAQIDILRTGGQVGAVSVSYLASDGSADGSDYFLTPGSVSWANDEAGLKSFQVTISDDAIFEGDEIFTISLHTPTGGASLAAPSNTTVTIVDDDVPPPAPTALSVIAVDRYQVDLSWTDNSDNESGFLVQRSTTSGSGFVDIALLAANATAYSDTNALENTTYYYRVGATNAFGIGLSSEGSDTTPATQHGTLSLSPAVYSVPENGGALTIAVTRTGGWDDEVSVTIGTLDGTAVSGSDYTSVSQTLTWIDEDSAAKSIDVPILDNGIYTGDRTFYLTLSNPMGGATIGAASAAVTISEDEPVPTGARVVAQTPVADTAQGPGVTQLTLTFNESIDTSSFDPVDDIASFTGGHGTNLIATITGYGWTNNDTQLTIFFDPATDDAVYRLVVGPDILNLAGWPMDQDQDSTLGEPEEDQYAASIWVAGSGTGITLWSDLVDPDDTPGPGWTLSGTDWEFGAPVEIPPAGPNAPSDSGTNILAQNLNGYYPAGTVSYAETPEIDATSSTAVYLDFQEWKGAGKLDVLYVDVGNGTIWQRAFSYTGPNGGANDTNWVTRSMDISSYAAGQAFRIRWGLDDTTTGRSGEQTGWQLDAIRVSGDGSASTPPPPAVLSHSPQGVVPSSVSSMYFQFSQPMDTASFDGGSDIDQFTGPAGPIAVAGFAWVSSTLLRVDFPAQTAAGLYSMRLNPALLDVWGKSLDQDKDGAAGEPTDDQYLAEFTINAVNQAPTVSILVPTSNTIVMSGSDLTITAQSSDVDGTVTDVRFYVDGTNLIEATSVVPTSSVVWSNVPMGNLFLLNAVAFDNDGAASTSATVTVVVDGDNDDIPDFWELGYGLSISQSNQAIDSDGDGHTDYEEYIALTIPTNSDSILRIVAVYMVNLTDLSVDFDSASNRVYAVQSCSNLTQGAWSDLATGIPGTGQRVTVLDSDGRSRRFYRVLVRQE